MKLVTALAGAWEDFTLVNKYMVLGGKEQRRAKINIPNPGRRAQRPRGASNWTSSPEGRRWCGCKGARRGGGRRRGARKARDRRARSTEGSMGAQRGKSGRQRSLGAGPKTSVPLCLSRPSSCFIRGLLLGLMLLPTSACDRPVVPQLHVTALLFEPIRRRELDVLSVTSMTHLCRRQEITPGTSSASPGYSGRTAWPGAPRCPRARPGPAHARGTPAPARSCPRAPGRARSEASTPSRRV